MGERCPQPFRFLLHPDHEQHKYQVQVLMEMKDVPERKDCPCCYEDFRRGSPSRPIDPHSIASHQ